jgi:type IV secretory pathway VirB9-like protein
MPAGSVVDDDNTERMATFHVQGGNLMVAHEVARRWRLRMGGQVICVFNETYAPAAGPGRNGTGTGSWSGRSEEARNERSKRQSFGSAGRR